VKEVFTKFRAFEAAACKSGLRVETERMGEGMTERDHEAATYAFRSGSQKGLADPEAEVYGHFADGQGWLFDSSDEYVRWCHEGDEEQGEEEGIRNVVNGFLRTDESRTTVAHAANMTNWRTLADEELQRRVWKRLLNALTDEQLAAIATGQVDFSAICREAAQCKTCRGTGVVAPDENGYDGCPACNYGDGPTGEAAERA
jgi:hypothetical protein